MQHTGCERFEEIASEASPPRRRSKPAIPKSGRQGANSQSMGFAPLVSYGFDLPLFKATTFRKGSVRRINGRLPAGTTVEAAVG